MLYFQLFVGIKQIFIYQFEYTINMVSEEKIVLRSISRPSSTDMKELTDWFIKVFDLGGKESGMETVMFKEIIINNIEGKGVTSKGLNKKLDVPRSTVIYHLNRFIYSGLV